MKAFNMPKCNKSISLIEKLSILESATIHDPTCTQTNKQTSIESFSMQ